MFVFMLYLLTTYPPRIDKGRNKVIFPEKFSKSFLGETNCAKIKVTNWVSRVRKISRSSNSNYEP